MTHSIIPPPLCFVTAACIYILGPESNYARTTDMDVDVHTLSPPFQQGPLTISLGLLFYSLIRVINNVYFHPLSRFPGPRGAACTKWWLAYMQLSRGVGISTLRVELHQKYGKCCTVLISNMFPKKRFQRYSTLSGPKCDPYL